MPLSAPAKITSPAKPALNSNVIGAALIVGAVFLMAGQDALIKYMSVDLALGQIFLLRSLMVLPLLTLLYRRGARHAWRGAVTPWPLLRGLFLTLMYMTLYSVIDILPLASLAAGFYTGPLFITLLAALLLKERVGGFGWAGIGIGFLGVLVLLRPGAAAFTPAALVPVLSGFLYALAAILARGKCRSDPPVSLALSLNLALLAGGAVISGFASLPLLGSDGSSFLMREWAPMKAGEWQLIVMLTVLMVGIGLGLAAAYQKAAPSIAAAFDYSYLIFATLFGFVLFAETPDLPTVTGMVLIASAGFLALVKR